VVFCFPGLPNISSNIALASPGSSPGWKNAVIIKGLSELQFSASSMAFLNSWWAFAADRYA
jgi:hypothetical protein